MRLTESCSGIPTIRLSLKNKKVVDVKYMCRVVEQLWEIWGKLQDIKDISACAKDWAVPCGFCYNRKNTNITEQKIAWLMTNKRVHQEGKNNLLKSSLKHSKFLEMYDLY